MELPSALRQPVDAVLQGVSARDLAAAAEALSLRYRGEVRDGRFHVSDDLTARAYPAARLPATYAAIRAALDAVAEVRPEFSPRSLLDFGAGPLCALANDTAETLNRKIPPFRPFASRATQKPSLLRPMKNAGIASLTMLASSGRNGVAVLASSSSGGVRVGSASAAACRVW